MNYLDGYKTYIVSGLTLLLVLVEGLQSGVWNTELGALALLFSTLRRAITTGK